MNRFFTRSVTVAAVGFSAVTALSTLATTPAQADHGALPARIALYPDQQEFLTLINALRAVSRTWGTTVMPAVGPVSLDSFARHESGGYLFMWATSWSSAAPQPSTNPISA